MLLDIISELTKNVDTLSSYINQGSTKNDVDINKKIGEPYRRYCWSCGYCIHWVRHCKMKEPGHKDEATFINRMGGSNKNCLGTKQLMTGGAVSTHYLK